MWGELDGRGEIGRKLGENVRAVCVPRSQTLRDEVGIDRPHAFRCFGAVAGVVGFVSWELNHLEAFVDLFLINERGEGAKA